MSNQFGMDSDGNPLNTPAAISQELAKNGIIVSEENITVSENGNVQITKPDQYVTITYNCNVPPSYGLTFKTGDGGMVAADYINTHLEDSTTPQTHVSTVYQTAFSGTDEATSFAASVKDELGLNNENNSGSAGYNIYGGSSAGAYTVLELAEKDPGHIDLVFCDAAYDAKQVVVDGLLKNPELCNKLATEGSIIFAFEGNNQIGGEMCGNPQDAVNSYMQLIVDENGNVKDNALNVVVALNDSLVNHGIGNNGDGTWLSPEHLVSDGTMNKVASGFNPNIASPVSAEGELNKYFFLKTPEFINGDYELGVGADGRQTFFTRDGWDLAKTEAELNAYVNSVRSYAAQTFMDVGKINNLSSFEESGSASKLLSVGSDRLEVIRTNYNSVSSAANTMINNLNNTACANKGITDYQVTSGTSAFPGSLNDANGYLFGITGQLMSDMKTEVASIEQMLNNYATTDSALALKASTLNFVSNPEYAKSIDFSKLTTPEIDPKVTNLFSNNIQQGRVGSISASDIQTMLSSNGIIMSGLSNEISDAKSLANSIQGLIDNTTIEGPAWTELKIHLNDYKLACEVRAQAASTLQAAYTEALNLVADYMAPDANLDDSRIPAIRANMSGIKQTISALRTKANTPVYESHYDMWTKSYYEVTTYPYKYLLDEIPALEDQYEELNKEVTKLEGLAGVMNQANQIVSNAIAEVNSTYGSAVSAIDPAVVSPTSTTVSI